ncbi:MAG TPA: hypothetical protein VMZ11_04125 [Mycobacteriales bacterium]|nr:hypothetical protein [Mycobacteriales bacterium]
MTPHECVRGIAGPVGRLGGAFMFEPSVAARGAELGLDPWAWYHCGRGGVLGNPHASVVVATFGFFPPALQTKAWNKGVAVMDPAEIAREYAAACVVYAQTRFAVEGAERLAELLTRALDSAEVAGLPLFAGWRHLLHDVPSDGPGRLGLALMAAREHRGGNHLAAVVAAGVPPLNAVMSGRYGGTNAEFFGWPQPWPDPADYADEMKAAEERTDALVQPAFEVLTAEERAELVAGLRAL